MILSKIIFLVIFLFILIKGFWKKEDFMLPNRLFILILSGCLFISTFKLSRLQHDFSIYFIIVMILGMGAFYLGSLFSYKTTENTSNVINYNENKFAVIIKILFLIILFAYFYTWYKLGPPPLFSEIDRASYYLPSIEAAYLLIYLLSFLLIYDFFSKKVLGNMFYFYMFSVLFMIGTRTNKFSIVYIFFMFFIVFNILKRRIKIKTFIMIGISIILLFVVMYSFVYNNIYISSSLRYTLNDMVISPKLSFLVDPYIYIMCNFENLNNYIINGPDRLFFGAVSFRSVFSILNVDYFTSDILAAWRGTLQYPWLTTGSMFKDFYMDFGLIGIIIMPFIIGLVSTKVYRTARQRKSIFACYLYTAATYSICMSFFTNYFSSSDFIINMIVALIASKVIGIKNAKLEVN